MAGNFSRASSWDVPTVGPVTEHATIGASIVIKGDVSGKEHLFIDGTVEGSIHFGSPGHDWPEQQGESRHPRARSCCDGNGAGEIFIALTCSTFAATSHIEGQIITRRVRIDDGAFLKGSVEIQHAEKEPREAPQGGSGSVET